MKDLLNSLTDGNSISANNSINKGMLNGPDNVQYGTFGTRPIAANMQKQDCGCNKSPMPNVYDAQASTQYYTQMKNKYPQAQK